MANAGHTTALKVSGAATAATNEATTSLGSNRYQVTNTARRVWDPAVAVTVKDGGMTVPATGYTFDYLFGIVALASAPSGAITVDGSWLSLVSVTEGRSFEFMVANDLLDDSIFGTAHHTKKAALSDVEISAEVLSSPLADLDAGVGGVQSIFSFLENATLKVFEVNLGSGAMYLRAFVLTDNVKVAAAVDSLVVSSISMKGAEQRGARSWSYGT